MRLFPKSTNKYCFILFFNCFLGFLKFQRERYLNEAVACLLLCLQSIFGVLMGNQFTKIINQSPRRHTIPDKLDCLPDNITLHCSNNFCILASACSVPIKIVLMFKLASCPTL